ncbi:hypothetical protein NP233_g10862 [Leucocoprinus birnbaumii]|uniref:Flavin-containing monooxygenase n=1 Tax=Leucocoprinus birnbaumii TaxID=56174 RepID=A0AAD5VHG4_9AGAR|nr:hypothetical protein NP233_g10862 [Leucocoprinus birnbaumii]
MTEWLTPSLRVGRYLHVLAFWNQHFDAVVVASGWYNTPNMPVIEGLEQWGQKFPKAIFHSRQYRYDSDYAGKKVLVVGAVARDHLISREVGQHSTKVYRSVRPQRYAAERPTIYYYVPHIPQNVSTVAEIKRFHASDSSSRTHASNLPVAPSSPVLVFILFLPLATAMASPSSPSIMSLPWEWTASLLLILFNLSLPMAFTYDRSTSTPSISIALLSASCSLCTLYGLVRKSQVAEPSIDVEVVPQEDLRDRSWQAALVRQVENKRDDYILHGMSQHLLPDPEVGKSMDYPSSAYHPVSCFEVCFPHLSGVISVSQILDLWLRTELGDTYSSASQRDNPWCRTVSRASIFD